MLTAGIEGFAAEGTVLGSALPLEPVTDMCAIDAATEVLLDALQQPQHAGGDGERQRNGAASAQSVSGDSSAISIAATADQKLSALDAQREAVQAGLKEHLGSGVTFGADGSTSVNAPPAGGSPLATYVHSDAAVNAVLQRARQQLPEHVQKIKLDLDSWSCDDVKALCNLLQRFSASTLSTDKWDVGFCSTLPFKVELRGDSKPVRERPYRYSPRMTELVRVEIDKLLAAGIIRPSLSEWASPVVAVLKPDGTARITVNYKKLNAQNSSASDPAT